MKNKITILLFGILFLNTTLNAQISTGPGGAASVLPNTPITNTNIGIGTNTPTAQLDVVGTIKGIEGEFTRTQPDGSVYVNWADAHLKTRSLNLGSIRDPNDNGRLFCFYDFPKSNLTLKSVFSLQIDDRSNHTRFKVNAETDGRGTFWLFDKNQTEYFAISEDGTGKMYQQMGKPDSKLCIGGYSNYVPGLPHKLVVQNGSALIEGNILTDANIGIGTSNFTDGSDTYRLSVKGKVRAEEVKVYNTWADYVFANNYDLKPLAKVEEYIAQNRHLPNVPSAKEITEKGLELGEMAKIQQEKIEELTLYLIQQNKEIEELKTQVKALVASKK
nr:hypothetical protein [uncultured Flavobacterium sp.]